MQRFQVWKGLLQPKHLKLCVLDTSSEEQDSADIALDCHNHSESPTGTCISSCVIFNFYTPSFIEHLVKGHMDRNLLATVGEDKNKECRTEVSKPKCRD